MVLKKVRINFDKDNVDSGKNIYGDPELLKRGKAAAIACCVFLIFMCNGLTAAEDYGILISVKPMPDSDLVEFRCESVVESTLGAVVSLFEDTDSMPEWVFRMKEAKTLKRISPTEVIAYTVTHLPWPLEDRDSVLHTTVSQNKKGLLCINGIDYSGYIDEIKGIVRMKRVRSSWEFEPLKGGLLKVVFSGTGDPGGVIPLAVFNSLIHEAPLRTMKKFREIIKRDKYKKGAYSYVKEYPDGI